LCKEGDPCTTILMFTIALDKKYRKTRNLAAQYYPFLLRYAEHHINAVASTHPSAGPTTIWAQAEDRTLERHFTNRAFTHIENKKSGNGYDLYSRVWTQPE
jgi:hypothetical protein